MVVAIGMTVGTFYSGCSRKHTKNLRMSSRKKNLVALKPVFVRSRYVRKGLGARSGMSSSQFFISDEAFMQHIATLAIPHM